MMPYSDEGPIGEIEAAAEEPQDIATLQQALAEAEERAAKYLANWQRAEADLANYKRHSDQEKQEIGRYANTTLMLNILPVLDDMERAFAVLPPRTAKRGWVDGVRLVERKLLNSLEALGLSRIEALGKPFDPNLHEAVWQDAGAEGTVVAEVQKGYKLHARVIRPSRVVVGNGETADTEGLEAT